MTTSNAHGAEEQTSLLDDEDEAAAARAGEEDSSSEPQPENTDEVKPERDTRFDISNDEEATFLFKLMTGGNDETELERDERHRAKQLHQQHHRNFRLHTMLSLDRTNNLGAYFSPRYELVWFPQIQHGQLVVDVNAVIEEMDEVHPDELLHNFGEMFDERTRGYLEGRVRDPQSNRLLPLVDANGDEVRMKAYYLRHSLLRLSHEERRHFRNFRSPFEKPGPRTLQLSYQRMLEAKWTPGDRKLGRTLGVPPHKLRELPEQKRNANRIFYTALVDREDRLDVQKTSSSVPFNMAFGLTPHIIPEFKDERAVLAPHKNHGVCPAGFVAVMAAPSMAAIQSNIEFAQDHMQKLFEERLCKLHFNKEPKDKVAKYSA